MKNNTDTKNIKKPYKPYRPHRPSLINYVLITLWVALMGIIIWFSNQPDYVSQEQSLTVGKWLCNIVVGGYENMSQTTQLEYAMMLDHFVRKSAHFCEFAVLGALTYNAFYILLYYRKNLLLFRRPLLTQIVLSILWCALFAASDEFHQLFVVGRYSSPLDVLLDTCGSATGIMLVVLILHIIRRIKSRSEKRSAPKL